MSKYRTYHTFEILKPEHANDSRKVAANCNAIVFRALHPDEPDPNGLGAVASYGLQHYAPRINGLVLLPALFPAVQVDQAGYGYTPTAAGLLMTPADMLMFDAGHPDAIDSTVYEVLMQGAPGYFGVGVMVIRRFMSPA